WLRKTKRKAMLAALEKIREELMLLGVISLLLSQTTRFISEICVPSSLFTSRFYICFESDYQDLLRNTDANQTALDRNMFGGQRLHVCGERSTLFAHRLGWNLICHLHGHEPFVLYEGLEQLHRFLFILGITHVLYSFVIVVLSMIKIYSWRKWETLAGPIAAEELKARRTKVMRRQSTFVFNNASHPWSKNKILIWMLCFLRQFKGSIIRSDYLALRLGFVTYHKLPHSYDFHKYMVRSMEDDYNGTIGISWPLWAYAIVCILINVHAARARRAAPTVSLPRLASHRAMASTKAPGPGEKHHSIDAQLRQLVPGKVFEDDKLIEYDALLVDRFLNILQDLHGPSLREFVQECYEVSTDYEGKGDTTKLGELSAKLTGLAPADAILVASSILHMLNLANLAEEVQITHCRRNSKLKKGGFADEGSATTESDIEETLKRLVSEVGKSPKEVFEALKNQTVDLVFTAHPTQSSRRSLLQKNARIRNCLTQLNARTSLTMTSRSSMRLCREWYLEKHELLEMRRIAAYIYKKAGRWKQSIALSKKDNMYKDCMETCSQSGDRELSEDLLVYFIEQGKKECFASCLFICYDLIRPDVALELAWMDNMVDFAFPYLLQVRSNFCPCSRRRLFTYSYHSNIPTVLCDCVRSSFVNTLARWMKEERANEKEEKDLVAQQ
ncbi:hypothetical protein ACJX0J_041089, partial [Zea mays]